MTITTTTTFIVSALILLPLTVAIYSLFLHPLSRIPGPAPASISNAWYAYHVRNGSMLALGKTIHRKYGPVVRIGPKEVWLDSKAAYRMIYSKSYAFLFCVEAHHTDQNNSQVLLMGLKNPTSTVSVVLSLLFSKRCIALKLAITSGSCAAQTSG